ncbi:MAG TPA: YdcF family protein [Bacteroidales bacterium]|nr:YdcF family protein [Bacteroidales bacterium]
MQRFRILRIVLRIAKSALIIAGCLLLFFVVMAFTTKPFYMHHRLGSGIEQNCFEPEVIVMLGAGGMPSGTNLMRLHYTAEAHRLFPDCMIYLLHPGDTSDARSSLMLMAQELIIRGVPEHMIRFLPRGKNTRAQALEFYEDVCKKSDPACVLLVTSPSHTQRSVLSFRKAGVHNLIPFPAFEIPFEGELRYDDDLGKKRRIMAPETGGTLSLRYEFWTQMNYQLIILREYLALAYYWVRGWV